MGQRRVDLRVVAALVVWAAVELWRGSAGFARAMGGWQRALADGIAGALLLAWGLGRGGRAPRGEGWWALVALGVLAVAETLLWRPYVDGVLHVHYLRAPVQSMVLLAAPMWLALLGAARWVPDAVPRKTVGAAIAAVAGYCLLLKANELSLRLEEVPALVLTVIWAMALVWAWSFARRTLAGCAVPVAAGCGLLVSAAVHALATLCLPKDGAQGVSWAEMWVPMGGAVLLAGAAAVLWFSLLQRMELAAFSMQQVVLLTGGLLVQFVLFGFLSWRLDVAVALCVGAIWTAMEARAEDEEPVRLGVVGFGSR